MNINFNVVLPMIETMIQTSSSNNLDIDISLPMIVTKMVAERKEFISFNLYRSAKLNDNAILLGDRFTPITMDIELDIHYFQDKQNIFNTL